MRRKKYSGEEHRRYIRLDSVFPIEFRLLSLDGKHFLSDWQQGFTNNIGKGGMCLSVNNLHPDLVKPLKDKQAKLSLDIEMPLNIRPIPAQAKIAWMRDAADEPNKYLIGLNYEEIDAYQNSKIIRYAWTKKLFVPVVSSIIIILGLGLAINSVISAKLIKGNKVLVEQLVKILQESSVAKQKVKELSKERQDLQLKIHALELRIDTAKEEKGKLETVKTDEIKQFNSVIEKLIQEKDSLEERLISLQRKEEAITEDLLRLDKRKATLEKANLDKMYQWLKTHQNRRSGLVMSFQGDKDVSNWAFIYDQALVAQAYTYFADFERVKKILNFFKTKAKKENGLFFNAYYVNDGNPVGYIMHSGPNIWLGIAILQYTKKSQDPQYLSLAEEIAQRIINLQNQDTQHNLDAYAFFNMLYKITAKPQYLQARDKVLSWLVSHTHDKVDIPIRRGKGDSTIATDTYAWSVAAIGPEKLDELGMNPDRIVEFAEQNCGAEVDYIRPEGQSIKIKGFDFAPERHVATGGVVSSEWTAQMVLVFKITANFYYKKGMIAKARAYEGKADTYLAELGNMIISSLSPSGQGESCLPYATQDAVDTGHGWMAPKGKSTGSVAGTVYTLFAYYNHNPLELAE